MTLIYVRRKSDFQVTEVSTQDPRRDEDYVGLSYQPLGKHKGEPYTIPWEEVELTDEEKELAELKAKYEEQEGKPVPNNKKNDIEWIKSKLA